MHNEDGLYPQEPEQTKDVTVTISVNWSNSAIEKQAIDAIVQQIHEAIEDKVRQAVFDQLDDVVNTIILESMEKTVQRTDGWGKPTGQAASVKDLLMNDIETWLNTQVDQYGRAGSQSYSRNQTRAQYLFKEATKDNLPKRIKDVIVKNIGDIDAVIESEVKRQLRAKLK